MQGRDRSSREFRVPEVVISLLIPAIVQIEVSRQTPVPNIETGKYSPTDINVKRQVYALTCQLQGKSNGNSIRPILVEVDVCSVQHGFWRTIGNLRSVLSAGYPATNQSEVKHPVPFRCHTSSSHVFDHFIQHMFGANRDVHNERLPQYRHDRILSLASILSCTHELGTRSQENRDDITLVS
jgi:hypothetical protein